MKLLKVIGFIILCVFALIGFVFSSVFVAMQFELLNVRGSIDGRNESILSAAAEQFASASQAIRLHSSGRIVRVATSSTDVASETDYSCNNQQPSCSWNETREWLVVAGGLSKDAEIINRVANETGVSPRLIASAVVPEQIRFFTAEREVFKRYFEPLKILGSLSKFSLGVSGIKQETALNIEKYVADTESVFYPGDSFAALLAYEPGVDQSDELFNRLTDEKDHYYSYLYTAIFIKEISMQWKKAGYDISQQPEIVATIFNIGFTNSRPNSKPEVGGSVITVGGNTYTFGELSGLFYASDQLIELQ